ncbi:CbtA family protein [Hoyosella sp. G463]|uniref:CbtA family protein n=1 Tax=Lolliginicoccus lacisalsi TaxID=2742202 RepID=A0A927PMX8_9ACTN|nr:CbtA family protein [Lolliginicoccus lacisalsi]MBD8506976.1 CbtA family protein [Lolliginicoccus lacisalsi]
MPLTDQTTVHGVAAADRPLRGSLGSLVLRGLAAGAIAGIAAGAVAFLLGEPLIDAAIAIEEAVAHTEGTSHDHGEDALISRAGQKLGLFLATTLIGMALGAIVAVIAHHARRRVAMSGPALVLAIAGCGWLALEAVPFFKYPANPPAVGDPATITERTLLWCGIVLVGLVAIGAGILARSWVPARTGSELRALASIAGFLAVVSAGYIVLPAVDEVGAGFPASLLWDFRMASLLVQGTLWLILGAAFALLSERAAQRIALD